MRPGQTSPTCLLQGYITPLDRLDSDVVVEGEWTKVNIGIGRQRAEFNFGFILTYIDEAAPFSAGVAVDDVTLFECALPPPEPECRWGK